MDNENIWFGTCWAVIKADGTYAGIPCTSYEEAKELSVQHEESIIYRMEIEEEE